MASLSLRHTLTHSLSFTHKSYCKFFFFSLKLLSKIGGGEVLKKYLKVIFEILLEPKTGKDFKFFCQKNCVGKNLQPATTTATTTRCTNYPKICFQRFSASELEKIENNLTFNSGKSKTIGRL